MITLNCGLVFLDRLAVKVIVVVFEILRGAVDLDNNLAVLLVTHPIGDLLRVKLIIDYWALGGRTAMNKGRLGMAELLRNFQLHF